ncbi:TerC family protein [Streptomonospora nanhaiensis]|uniref:Tellurite resistance protein TerC n=1 Tax=Streptomonospora nanhaiensis TaxID=1323731 RepID=A0A853BIQ9_9ACTN|nr:TerC family protein [Streptomonospora nanhaiensis]MBV2365069.1 TerC family protein [Streptomonospora nanhaiensis]NYI94472.1 tellurite resistance protein TerC [Streptomonospora nanhaiensis]
MEIAPWVWGVTIAVLLGVILIDFIIIARRPHEPSMREAAIWISVYVSLAIVFGIGLAFTTEGQAVDFFTGWIVEYSMSMDNLFVFILILGSFAVPREHRQRVLLVGIALALVFRGLFIAVGAAAVNAFAGVFYLFGAFLLYTAWKLVAGGGDDEEEYKENAAVRMVRRVLPTTDTYHDAKLVTRIDGKRVVTPMLLVMIAVGLTDILFALDSIPAIFGITQEPYLVFTANAFALMGLRQLYFLIGGLLDKLVYLSHGLAVILGFIGVKLILHAVHETTDLHVPEIPTTVSLVVIVLTLAVTAVASLVKSRRDAAAAPAASAGAESGEPAQPVSDGGDDDRGERVSV